MHPEDDPPPIPPGRPPDEACCGQGCTPCVFDSYEEALARYEAAMKEWRARHPD